MFPTETKSACLTRPNTTASYGQRDSITSQDDYAVAQKKLKLLKQHAKQIKQQYKEMKSQINFMKRSIETVRHQTCKTRLNLMKSLEAKKVKIEDDQLKMRKQVIVRQQLVQQKNKNRIFKLNSNLQSFVTRSEKQRIKESIRSKNKAEKFMRRSQIMQIKTLQQIYSKQKYETIKQSQQKLAQKKKQIANMLSFRAQENYRKRYQNQRHLIQSYDAILKQVEGYDQILAPFQTIDKSPTFFLTVNSHSNSG